MDAKEKIIDALRTVIDPEIGINIVDLGLIYDVIVEEQFVYITMTLTTPGCPMHNTITSWVENVVNYQEPNKEVLIKLVWEPKWHPDKMSDYAKEQLGI